MRSARIRSRSRSGINGGQGGIAPNIDLYKGNKAIPCIRQFPPGMDLRGTKGAIVKLVCRKLVCMGSLNFFAP